MDWDVIVVGARCAGAALGASLARAGVRTLIVDADKRGSDMPMSTHYMQPPGMDALDRLGVGERVRAVTPPIARLRIALDDTELIAPHRPGYCARRSTLDPMLQDAAEASGAELRCSTRLVDLVQDRSRVTGVVVESKGSRERITADLVVGADGAHSTVAKLTGAREYLISESTRGGYFAYYPAPAAWEAPWDATLEHRGLAMRTVFRTDGDLVLLAGVLPAHEVAGWGKGYREKLHEVLLGSPTTRPFVEGKQPVGKVMGLLRPRYFYREPVGSGWVLVGDAGHYKDFSTAQGMTDALLAAERLAQAIVSPARSLALEHFWRERDVLTLPLHYDALAQGGVGYNTPLARWVLARAAQAPDQVERVRRVMDRELSPDEFVPPGRLLSWLGAACVHGRFDVLGAFVAEAKQRVGQGKELAARRRLLQRAARALRAASAQPAAAGAADVVTA